MKLFLSIKICVKDNKKGKIKWVKKKTKKMKDGHMELAVRSAYHHKVLYAQHKQKLSHTKNIFNDLENTLYM